MVWYSEDKKGFTECSLNNIGQINIGSSIGNFIVELIKSNNFKLIYDVGCWNGQGTTKCIAHGIEGKDTQVYSFEINKEKWEFARQYYSNNPNIHFIHGTVGHKRITWDDIIQVFPHLQHMEQSKYLCLIDLANSQESTLFTPHEHIDLVVHDGGDWDSYFIYKDLQDRVTHWILDDINVDKNKLVCEDLMKNKNYELVRYEPNDRNGWAYFRKI